jgi:hypothetical protein
MIVGELGAVQAHPPFEFEQQPFRHQGGGRPKRVVLRVPHLAADARLASVGEVVAPCELGEVELRYGADQILLRVEVPAKLGRSARDE